jgi:4-cresol dehydrogenase (hydroxylating)
MSKTDAVTALAIDRLSRELGAEFVMQTRPDLEPFFDPFPVGDPNEFGPGLAVQPASVEQVQAVLRIANELKAPVWAVSQGRNNGYGGGSPRLAGSIMLDLKRMNRILDVDEVSGTALVEPGVRFFDLHSHLRDNGSAYWPSVPDLGWGSVMGNALDRGFGYTAYGMHNDMSCGLEVVLPEGALVRTGMGSMVGSKSWQLYKPGFGPSVDGIFAQSNLGVVTKMGLWLMPRPEVWAAIDIQVPEFTDLVPLIDAMRPLKLDGTIQSNVVIADALGHATFGSQRSHWYTGEGPIPESVTRSIMADLGIGHWNMYFALYDHRGMLEARIETVKRAFEKVDGLTISVTRYEGDTPDAEIAAGHHTRAGIPGMNAEKLPYWWGGRGGHIGFAPVSPMTGRDALAQAVMTKRRCEEFGFDFVAAFTAGPRSMAHVAELLFDRDNPDQVSRVRQAFSALVTDAAAEGYGEYRTHIAFMDLVAAQNNFNDNALLHLQEKLKDALDPNGILAPGKQGVWPRHLRHDKISDTTMLGNQG